jgi:transposase InsO family protein
MHAENLLCRRKKRFRPVTTQSNHGYRTYPNLAKDLEVTGLNQLWVADITYIRLLREFVYLAIIEDIFSRKCIGWNLGRDIDTQLTLGALNMAVFERVGLGFSNLIHHSDLGVQYAADEYVEKLSELDIKISMSRKGNVYDNAFAESFMKTLKVEEVYMNEYETFQDALKNIKRFIEEVYNEKRLHSSIGYTSPNKFEREVLNITLT